MSLVYKKFDSPLGRLKLIASANALVGVLWEREPPGRVKLDVANFRPRQPVLIETERQLEEYFAGARMEFHLPLEWCGSAFEKKIWRALTQIPFGQTRSYLELAKAVGSARAVRAVGAANGRNPLGIVVPCHRVIGANGSLTGFAGGLQAKAKLLALEARVAAARKNE